WPSGRNIGSLSWSSCALVSCRQTTSAFCWRSHSNTPLVAAERMPLAFRLMMRMRDSRCGAGIIATMAASPDLHVCPVTPALREAVLRLHARPGQDGFVSPPARTLADAEQCAGSEPMTILLGATPIGYYRIEHNARSLTGLVDDVDALGLRSFQLDAYWQGRGLAMRAMEALLADLAQRHPQARPLRAAAPVVACPPVNPSRESAPCAFPTRPVRRMPGLASTGATTCVVAPR